MINSRFEFFDSGVGLKAVRMGIIPVSLLSKYDFYKTYLELLKAGNSHSSATILASDACRCHRSSIYRAIYWFERDDPDSAKYEDRGHLRITENKQVA